MSMDRRKAVKALGGAAATLAVGRGVSAQQPGQTGVEVEDVVIRFRDPSGGRHEVVIDLNRAKSVVVTRVAPPPDTDLDAWRQARAARQAGMTIVTMADLASGNVRGVAEHRVPTGPVARPRVLAEACWHDEECTWICM